MRIRATGGSRKSGLSSILLGESLITYISYTVGYSGNHIGPSPPPLKGGSPQKGLLAGQVFVCASLIVYTTLEPDLTDCPPVRFWYNPNVHMNYSNYL